MARDHYAICLDVITGTDPSLLYSSWTIQGRREEVVATPIGMACFYGDGEYASYAINSNKDVPTIQSTIRSCHVSEAVVHSWFRKMAPVAVIDPKGLRTDWLLRAFAKDYPECVLAIEREANGEIIVVLYCGPPFNPRQQLHRLKSAAQIVIDQQACQQRRSN